MTKEIFNIIAGAGGLLTFYKTFEACTASNPSDQLVAAGYALCLLALSTTLRQSAANIPPSDVKHMSEHTPAHSPVNDLD